MTEPDITIPDEAIEAAARAIATMEGVPEAWVLRQVRARFAILAMLKHWPGALTQTDSEPTWVSRPAIILPLHKENTNAEG